MTILDRMVQRVQNEIEDAEHTYSGYWSTHEALGVLCEEWDELRAAIHEDNAPATRDEALQIAAVALRLAVACQLAIEAGSDDPTHFSRRSFKWARS